MKKRLIAFAAAAIIGIFTWLGLGLLLPGNSREHWRLINISPGASLLGLVEQLREERLLSASGKPAFLAAAALTGRGRRLQPGRYRLSASMSAWEILSHLAEGRTETIWITIPEGFTLRQIGVLLEAKGIGKKEDFLALAVGQAALFNTPFPREGPSLEGYLFPDTYKIDGRQGAEEVIGKMLARFEEVVWKGLFNEKRTYAGRSLHEIITLASLVEGEAKLEEERPLIAGVLVNRLRAGLKLECDASVQYALGERSERLTFRHLETPSPYNTYLHAGLPPGPINNPGRASIQAAMRPAATNFLFYVARPDGSHVFSRTFSEHRAAIAGLRRE